MKSWAEGFEIESEAKYRFKWLYVCTYWFVKYKGHYVGVFYSKEDAEKAVSMYKQIEIIDGGE